MIVVSKKRDEEEGEMDRTIMEMWFRCVAFYVSDQVSYWPDWANQNKAWLRFGRGEIAFSTDAGN